jgi:hypothetical protein
LLRDKSYSCTHSFKVHYVFGAKIEKWPVSLAFVLISKPHTHNLYKTINHVQLYHDENKLRSNEILMISALMISALMISASMISTLYLDQHAKLEFS